MHQFDKCIGVELLESLHNKQADLKILYDSEVKANIGTKKLKDILNYQKAPEFEVNQGDLLEFNWTNGDFVLANSTCFEM